MNVNEDSAPLSLETIRVQAKLSQRKLAEKIQMTPSFVNLIESGKRGASLSTLEKLKAALGLDDVQYARLSAWFAAQRSGRAETPA